MTEPAREPRRDASPVLPDQTRDDTDLGWGERDRSGDDDRLLEDRPPHWGRD
jgi:hypothetical protein